MLIHLCIMIKIDAYITFKIFNINILNVNN